MITDAITTLKERNGSSQPAISKFIQHKHNKALPPNFKSLLSHHLKKFVKSEKLFKVKNSYKVYETTNTNQKKTTTVTTITATTPPKRKGGKKLKSLSQVKTPEALKKKSVAVTSCNSAVKVKRLSQVKTPEGMKKKKRKINPRNRRLGNDAH
ncbi:hypothetical protein RIF29_22375 [Crotalaria pallida]|uniref:H15 domain-containing protein n=1 Tax=Crotalaria pallida TaxID=3830 RepID=A0AAN9F8Q9_CROPI